MQYKEPEDAEIPSIETVKKFVRDGKDVFEVAYAFPNLSIIHVQPIYNEAAKQIKDEKQVKVSK